MTHKIICDICNSENAAICPQAEIDMCDNCHQEFHDMIDDKWDDLYTEMMVVVSTSVDKMRRDKLKNRVVDTLAGLEECEELH